MAFQQRELSGALFREREKKNERDPDYQGNCLIDGRVWKISGGIKYGRNGKFLSLAFSKPLEGQSSEQ